MRSPWRACLAVAAAAFCAAVPRAQTTPASPPLSIRITSPLGRTGVAGTVRIVAQVRTADEHATPVVHFLVDGKEIKAVYAPPYATEWVDDDPMTSRVITVNAEDGAGHTAQNEITLEPFAVQDSADVVSVVLEAAVYNKAGRFVSGLTPGDFVLHENGAPQVVDLATQMGTPVMYGVLVDSSHSMSYSIAFVREAARRLATYLRPIDRVLLAPFSVGLGPITGPTNDGPTLVQAIDAIGSSGGTAILDSLAQMADRLGTLDPQVRRAIVLLTDGYDENSEGSVEDALKAVHRADATVYVIGIGGVAGVSLKGQAVLKELAAATGGRAFFPYRNEDLPATYDSLAVDVQSRYLLSYTPTDAERDGTWRAIDVTTKNGDLVTQTRTGYYAPQPPPVRPNVEFTVSDPDQRYFDVTADDLAVFEDGVEQKVDVFHEAVSPVSVVLALDASGSMQSSTATVISAAREFVEALRPEDALGVEMFADRSTLVQDLSKARADCLDAIDQYKANGGTALYDALADAFVRLARVDGRRAVVVVTDGRDENNPGTAPGSVRTFDDDLRLLKESGAIVFGVGVGAKVDRHPLEELAKESGGQAYFPTDASELPAQYARIVENLRRRFALGYASTNAKRDGTWRHVEIRLKSPGLTVSSAGGYFAPGK